MRCGRAAVLLALAVTLTGCSLLGVAYRNADRLLVMYADRWLDLDRAQKASLRTALRMRLAAHQRDELPQYRAGLERLRAAVAAGPADADLEWLFEETRRLWDLGFARSLDIMSATLADLSAAQVAHLEAEMAESATEYAAEVADTEGRRAARVGEMTREVERWTGRLDAQQRAIIAGLVDSVPDSARAWTEYRSARQQALLALLRERPAATAVRAHLQAWFLDDVHLDPALAARWRANRTLYAQGLARLGRALDARQRARVLARLDSLADDLAGLQSRPAWVGVDPLGPLFYNEVVAP